jgi:DNA modification methylase
MVPIAELKTKFNPKNRNVHPPAQIDRLAEILKYQGARKAAVLSKRSGYLTAGHGRIMAAERAGWKEYPVDYQDYDDEAQEFADLTADNAVSLWAELDLAGINQDALDFGPDFDLDMLGIKDFELVDPTELEPGCDEDAVPEVVEPKAKLGDIYQLGRHRLMCGDSTSIDAVEKLMADEKADMVFTDPPYGINESAAKRVTRETNSLAKSNSHLKEFKDDSIQYAIDAFNLCQGLAIPIQIWFGANYYCHSLPQTNNWLVWDKRLEDKQIDNNSDAELAWVQDGRSSVRIFRHLWKGLIKGSERGESRVHPTQKPIALAEWCIEKYEPKSVLDLFGGSGSTLIACEKTNRKCFMMELDPHYVDVIVARWEKYTGKTAELING